MGQQQTAILCQASTSSSPVSLTAAQRKLSVSPYFSPGMGNDKERSDDDSDSSSSEYDHKVRCSESEGCRMFEVSGLQSALQGVLCKECESGPILYKEDISIHQGLNTNPSLYGSSVLKPYLWGKMVWK